MTKQSSLLLVVLLAGLYHPPLIRSQTSPPFTAEEREAVYTTTIDRRTKAIVESLALSDATKSNAVHQIILAQYRTLRGRDEAIEGMLRSLGQSIPGIESNRAAVVQLLSPRLHREFFEKLAGNLSAAQIETVKDKMTYNKLKVTYDAYCEIVPGLTEPEKKMISDTLKAAREEAIDGGSADEKSAIFQRYKDQINARLASGGHDVAKATHEWEAKQVAVQSDQGTATKAVDQAK